MNAEVQIKRIAVRCTSEEAETFAEAAESAGVMFLTGKPNVSGWCLQVLRKAAQAELKKRQKDQSEEN